MSLLGCLGQRVSGHGAARRRCIGIIVDDVKVWPFSVGLW